MTTEDKTIRSSLSGKDKDPQEKGFFNRPGMRGKTMWNWLDLFSILTISIVIIGATIGFGLLQVHLADLQHQSDQQRALDQQQATILQTYIDNIQDLMVNHNLLGSKPDDGVAIVAEARTLTALQGLDPERKGLLVQFLYQAQLIGFHGVSGHLAGYPIIRLAHADLKGVRLEGTDLAYVDLNLSDLAHADLSGANLVFADLIGADLSGANLNNTNLDTALLHGADLSGASITQEQLDHALCAKAILPKGLTCHNN